MVKLIEILKLIKKLKIYLKKNLKYIKKKKT